MDTWIFQGGYPVVEAELVGDRTAPAPPGAVPLPRRRRRRPMVSEPDVGRADPVPLVGRGPDRARAGAVRPIATMTSTAPNPSTGCISMRGDRASTAPATEVCCESASPVMSVSSPRSSATTSSTTPSRPCSRARRPPPSSSSWRAASPTTPISPCGSGSPAAFGTLDRIVDDDTRVRLQATVRAIAAPALHRMGWTPRDGESDRERQTRATLFEFVGVVARTTTCATRARALHESYVDDPASVDPAMAAAAVNVHRRSRRRRRIRGVPAALSQVRQPAGGDALPLLAREVPGRRIVRAHASNSASPRCARRTRRSSSRGPCRIEHTAPRRGSSCARNWSTLPRAVPVEHDGAHDRRRADAQ